MRDDRIIDLSAARNAREQPDAEHVRHDDFGRPLYRFLIRYEMGGSQWGWHIWAYSMEDARCRVDAMRATLSLDGQCYSTVPA